MARDLVVSSRTAGDSARQDHDPYALESEGASSPQRSVVLLLDAATGGDMERTVSRLLMVSGEADATGVIVSDVAIAPWCGCEAWRTIVVPDIARVAAAFGVMTLPAVVLTGAVEESQQRIDAIVRRIGPRDDGRVSGAMSSGDLW